MADIALNAGIRSNLLQLQRSSSLYQDTTQRLASGKKVNSAIDSPTNFFAAVNLSDRAEGLSARLDGIGQAVQTVKAADNGISGIRSFISAMQGVVNNALGNTDATERQSLGRQFNELLVQVAQTAKDASCKGSTSCKATRPTPYSLAKHSTTLNSMFSALTWAAPVRMASGSSTRTATSPLPHKQQW